MKWRVRTMRTFSRTKTCFLIVALCMFCCAISGCPESNFELAKDSRLPQWITIPPGLTRQEVSVEMEYYLGPLGGSATFTLKDKNGRKLTKVEGKTKGRYPLLLKNPPPGFD